ncbi:MAG: type II toxin-antitoxin system VapC family toxin [Gemmataceae bacterium]
MVDYFFDTSALSKHYQQEVGTAVVGDLLVTAGSRQFVSRLAAVEFHSALAKKVRTGQLTAADFHALTRRFRADVTAKRFEVVRVLVAHFGRRNGSSPVSGRARTSAPSTPCNSPSPSG